MSKRAYRVQAVVVNTAGGIDFNLTQVDSWGHTPNLDLVLLKGAGALHRTFAYVRRGQPMMRIATPQLGTLLAETYPKLKALTITSDETHPGVTFYLARMDSLGAMAGSTHVKMVVSKGLMTFNQVRAQDGQGPAVALLDVHAVDDGTNDPVAITAGQALGIATTTATEAYELGPAQINNTTLTGITSMTIDGGNRVEYLWGDGDVFPAEAYLVDHNPTMSLGSTYIDILATLGIGGTAIDANDATAYLRQCVENNQRAAVDSGTHISFNIDDGMAVPMPSDFAADPPIQSCDVMVQPTWDESNDTIAVATNASYTI